jgi:hypothetical protein
MYPTSGGVNEEFGLRNQISRRSKYLLLDDNDGKSVAESCTRLRGKQQQQQRLGNEAYVTRHTYHYLMFTERRDSYSGVKVRAQGISVNGQAEAGDPGLG